MNKFIDYDDMGYFIQDGLRKENINLDIETIHKVLNLETEYIIEVNATE